MSTETIQPVRGLPLCARQQSPAPEMPQWGRAITTGEMITLMLQREGTRDDALEALAQTLADLGISGEEIAHWQKRPGICSDCQDTDERLSREWTNKARGYPQEPIEMYRGYTKAEAKARLQTGYLEPSVGFEPTTY